MVWCMVPGWKAKPYIHQKAYILVASSGGVNTPAGCEKNLLLYIKELSAHYLYGL